MKLTKEQITYIENYIKSFNIKYYEVYMEILDHIILSVEEILANDTEIAFEDAVVRAKLEGFGKNGFRGMMDERVKMLNKTYRLDYQKQMKNFFKFPQIMLTFVVFLLCFGCISFFEKPQKVVFFLILSLVLFVFVDWIKINLKYGKKNKLNVLKASSLGYYSNTVFLWMYILNGLNGGLFFDFSQFVFKIISSIMFTICFISFLIYNRISKKTIEELKTQIFV
jgi:hypothetical protein